MRYGAGILACFVGGGVVGASGGYFCARLRRDVRHRGTDAVAGMILGAVAGMLVGIVVLA